MTGIRRVARRWLAEPLLHFVLIGAFIFLLYASYGRSVGDAGAGGEIVVTQGRIRSLVETFSRQWSRAPSDDELAGLVRDFVREEVLAREALALGLDRDDTIVRRRLAQKMEFVADTEAPSDPTDDELRAFLDANPERFRIEPRISFSQVFLDRGRRRDALERDVATLLARLNAAGEAADIATLGDSRLLDARYDDVSTHDVAARFGGAFAEKLQDLPLARFVGPIESGYGAHLVRVERRTGGRVPAIDEVRDAVAREWKESKRRDAKDAYLQAMLARYRVTIEPDPASSREQVAGTTR
jgi:hypothetical protein